MVATQLISAEQLLKMPNARRCELVAGELRTMTPVGLMHGGIELQLAHLLKTHVDRTGAGLVVSGEAGFFIAQDPDTVRAADVAFIRKDRLPRIPRGFFKGAPDLAVEVVSPSDREADVDEKTEAWLAAGTCLVWVVWPNTRTITVHRRGAEPKILHEPDALSGEDVIAGFECPVADVFRL
jgi:Uma2 family endonuclease